MKICLSGSMTLIDQIEELSKLLELLGHQTSVPSRGTEPEFASTATQATAREMKAIFVADHLKKIREADALLIANFQKNGIDGYIGLSALMEAAMAYALEKRILVLNTPAIANSDDDLSSIGAIELKGDLKRLC